MAVARPFVPRAGSTWGGVRGPAAVAAHAAPAAGRGEAGGCGGQRGPLGRAGVAARGRRPRPNRARGAALRCNGGGGGWWRAECGAVLIVLCSAAGCELKAEKEYQFKVDDEENEHQLSLRTVSTVCSSVARSEFSCCQKGGASCEFISSRWISAVTGLFLQIFCTISSTCWGLNVWFCLLDPSVSTDTLWLIKSKAS